MKDLLNGNDRLDDEVVFCDGILWVLTYCDGKPGIQKVNLCSEYDKPICLFDIAERFPHVVKVIFEDWTSGCIFNYGNHPNPPFSGDGKWELVGTTVGFS